MKALSRRDKFLPADGSIPPRAQYTCKTCKAWMASRTGSVGHEKRFPGHVLVNVKTGFEVGKRGPYSVGLGISSQNGHSSEISPALLEYAFSKMRSTIESELGRLHDQLIPSPEPATRRSKFYVAR